MANVKISELPSATALGGHSVVIVNDVSDNTTKKSELTALYAKTIPLTVTGSVGVTLTGTINANAYRINPHQYFIHISSSEVTLTNATSERVIAGIRITQGGTSNFGTTGESLVRCSVGNRSSETAFKPAPGVQDVTYAYLSLWYGDGNMHFLSFGANAGNPTYANVHLGAGDSAKLYDFRIQGILTTDITDLLG